MKGTNVSSGPNNIHSVTHSGSASSHALPFSTSQVEDDFNQHFQECEEHDEDEFLEAADEHQNHLYDGPEDSFHSP